MDAWQTLNSDTGRLVLLAVLAAAVLYYFKYVRAAAGSMARRSYHMRASGAINTLSDQRTHSGGVAHSQTALSGKHQLSEEGLRGMLHHGRRAARPVHMDHGRPLRR
jgi:hypothetical protein